MQHRLAKLMLGTFFLLACAGSSLAASTAPPNEDSVPLVKEILDGPVPSDMNSLKTEAAELFQLGFTEDAKLLAAYGERNAFLHLLNRPYTPAATVREALKQEANAKISLDQLRTDFMHEGYSIQVNTMVDQEESKRKLAEVSGMMPGAGLLPLQPGLWGAFHPDVTHSTGRTIRDVYQLFVWMKIRNQTVESGQFTLAVPVAGPNPMRCKFNTVDAGGTGLTYCVVYMEADPLTKERMIAALTPMLDGHPLSVASSYQFSPNNYPNPVTSTPSALRVTPEAQFGRYAWETAESNIAHAGCEKLGTCVGVLRTYATNRGFGGIVMISVIMLVTLGMRWFGNSGKEFVGFLSWCFWAYFVLVALAGFLFYIDPPNSGGLYPGLFSGIAAYVLSMPWNFFMSALEEAVPYRAFRHLGEHDFAWEWFFIFVNLTYLGLMAFLRRSRRQRVG